MPIPGFQEMMLPVLRLASNGQEIRLRDSVTTLSDEFGLSDSERAQLVPSGQQTVVHNRIAWARTYLTKAGLLKPTRRGYVCVTDDGRHLLATQPQRIDVAFLRKTCPVINEFLEGTVNGNESIEKIVLPVVSDQTPEEALELAYQRLRQSLAEDVLSQAKEMSPQAFERLVVELLVKMGYGGTLKDAGRAVGQSGDGGIDGIIKEDRLGLDTIYLQAKRYTDQAVGRSAIQAFVGALQGVRARKGIFITTSRFAAPAMEYVASIETKVVLIDGPQLAEYMIDFDLGVTRVSTFEGKDWTQIILSRPEQVVRFVDSAPPPRLARRAYEGSHGRQPVGLVDVGDPSPGGARERCVIQSPRPGLGMVRPRGPRACRPWLPPNALAGYEHVVSGAAQRD